MRESNIPISFLFKDRFRKKFLRDIVSILPGMDNDKSNRTIYGFFRMLLLMSIQIQWARRALSAH
jgi:hypothetical protein